MGKKLLDMISILGLAFCLISVKSFTEEQELIFSDDFTAEEISSAWKLGPAKGWEQSDSQLTSTGYKGSAILQKELGKDFTVEANVKLLEPDAATAGGYAGIRISGINFVLRQDGFWCPYQRPGAERYSGDLKKAEITLHRWYHFRILVRTGGIFEWYVDGEKICELVEPDMQGDVMLFVYGFKTAYGDFKVKALLSKSVQTTSVNLIRNSSFEIVQDSLPLFWGTSGFNVPADGTLDEFYRAWCVDNKEKYHGNNSLRISRKNCRAFSYQYPAQKEKSYVFSAYLKADSDGIPVNLSIWEWLGRWHKKTIKVTPQWQRYEIVMSDPEKNVLRGVVELAGNGTIWIDAVQLEEGTNPAEYCSNPLDTADTKSSTDRNVPETKIVKADVPPVIDGRLDDPAWKTAAKSPPFLISSMGGDRIQPKEKTDAYLCYDMDNLYIGFKCFDTQIDKLKAALTGKNAVVWLDECVEVFLDTNHDRKTYYQFSVNPLGAQNVQDFATKLPWGKNWSVKTDVQKEKGYWTVEIALPFASLDIAPFTAENWGINLCRENHKANEYSCTGPVAYMNFHNVSNYGMLKWPDKKVFSDFLYEIKSIVLKPLGTVDNYTLEGNIKNNSACSVVLRITGSIGEQVQGVSLALPAGMEKSFSFGKFLTHDSAEVQVKIMLEDEKEQRIVREDLHVVSPSYAVDVLAEKSYYTDEKTARIALNINFKSKTANYIAMKLQDQSGKVLWTSRPRVTAPQMTVEIPMAKVPCGDHILTAVLSGPEKFTVSSVLKKLPPKSSEVKIDRVRRVVLVNDKPFLTIAPLESFLFGHEQFYKEGWEDVIEKSMEYWSKAGFASLCVVGRAFPIELAEKGWRVMLDSAEKHGLKIIVWPGHLGDIQVFTQFINLFKAHPAVLTWLVFDEPEIQSNVKPEQVIERVTAARGADPYHPVYVNYTPLGPAQRYAGLPGDIISTDYYVMNDAEKIASRTIREVVNIVNMKEKIAEERHIPTWMFIAGNNLSNHCRELPAQQQESQTYAAVIAGCSGLKYFFGHPYGINHWETLKRVNNELLSLSAVLFSPEERPDVKSSTPAILVTARMYEGKIYILAVNIENETLPVSLELGTDVKTAGVLFEERTVPLAGKILKDTFQPYQRHVYLLE